MYYPGLKNKEYKITNIKYGNRGMILEDLINNANDYYIEIDRAIIYKKPTPIGLVSVDYKKNEIKKAYFKDKSTFDYNGIYRGRYVDFEAKESHNKTSFPLANIHAHQILHLRRVLKHGAIAFFIIYINNEYYLLKGEDFLKFIEENTRKSIPYEYIKTTGYRIKEKLNPTIDYLNIVDEVYFEGVD